MIKKTVRYEDFNGRMVEENLYFHLSKSEIIELEVGKKGGLGDYLQKMVASEEAGEILAAFKMIIAAAYGTRSEDGKSFDKDKVVTEKFMKGPAFDALFMELVVSEQAVTEFALGLVPKDLAAQVDTAAPLAGLTPREVTELELPVPAEDKKPWADREPTQNELRNMSREDLLEVMKRKMQSPSSDIPPAA